MSFAVRDHVERLGRQLVEQAVATTGRPPACAFDEDWPSPCVIDDDGEGRCVWRPKPIDKALDFSGLQRALECAIHLDVVGLFGGFWSGNLPVRYEDNEFELLQVWSAQDFDNLLTNFIGHALEKRRVRQPLTLFFAVVDDSQFLSVDNASGEVLLETLGRREPVRVHDSLAGFLGELSPYWRNCDADNGLLP